MYKYSFVVKDVFCDSLCGWTDDIACICKIYEYVCLFVGNYVCSTMHICNLLSWTNSCGVPPRRAFEKKTKNKPSGKS